MTSLELELRELLREILDRDSDGVRIIQSAYRDEFERYIREREELLAQCERFGLH